MTTTKVVESGLVANKENEAPTSLSEEEPRMEGGKESSGSDKEDPQIRVSEETITKIVESGLVVNKKEETSISSSEEETKKGSEELNPATGPDCGKKDP